MDPSILTTSVLLLLLVFLRIYLSFKNDKQKYIYNFQKNKHCHKFVFCFSRYDFENFEEVLNPEFRKLCDTFDLPHLKIQYCIDVNALHED